MPYDLHHDEGGSTGDGHFADIIDTGGTHEVLEDDNANNNVHETATDLQAAESSGTCVAAMDTASVTPACQEPSLYSSDTIEASVDPSGHTGIDGAGLQVQQYVTVFVT